MTKASATRLISLSSFILIGWGIIYIILSGSIAIAYTSPNPALLRLECVSKGILFIFMGMILFHLPSLLNRGEYQALRILNFTFLFLLVLTIWHAFKSPLQEIPLKATLIILGICSLLLLIALAQLRRGHQLPRF